MHREVTSPVTDLRAQIDDGSLRLRGILLGGRHLPGKHDQSSHGRPGVAGAAKAIAKKAVKAATTASPATKVPRTPRKSNAKSKPAASKPKHDADGQSVYRPGRDISDSAAYDRISAKLNNKRFGEDPALAEVLDQQGFNGHPHVVSRDEFDRQVAEGAVTEVWRGLNGPDGVAHDYAEAYRSGEHFPGVGVYGNGTYVAYERADADRSAGRWEPGSTSGVMLRIGLRSDARVISIEELRALHKKDARQHAAGVARAAELDEQMRRAAERATTTEQRIAIYAEFGAKKAQALGDRYLASRDIGRFAALLGYDAIDIRGGQGGDQMVILNRTAAVVQEDDL